VAAPEALGHHCTLLCNCRDELPNFAQELAGEANAEAGDWWKRAQEVSTEPGGPPRWHGQSLYSASTFRALVS